MPAPFASIFDSVFDTVVFGAGFIGLAAARALAARGDATLMIESSGDLLQEATRALENSAADPVTPCADWENWLGELRARQGADARFFEPALAEIFTAHELSAEADRPAGQPRVLLYASPVTLETTDGAAISVILATKDGPRRVHARRLIDATEHGVVARLANPALAPRAPQAVYRSLVLHSLQIGKIDAALPRLAEKHPGLEWFSAVRADERRLRWPTDAGKNAWHRKVPALVADLRQLLAASDTPDATFVVSHCAMLDHRVYAAAPAPMLAGLPANLVVASPTLRGEALATPGERFALGADIAAALPALPSPAPHVAFAATPPAYPAPALTLAGHDVLVAGAGTGGAVAAISAAQAGARTLVLDATPYPGGVGTGSGICGYFHGAKGGLQSEIDQRTQTMGALLTGANAVLHAWHHEAKKIVLLDLFAESGATFLGNVFLAGVERDASGRVLAALAVVEGRLARLPAAAFIDATGDGDLATLAGASVAEGRPGDGRTLSYSQSIFSIKNHETRLAVRSCNFDAGWVDPNNPEDFTRARLVGIAQHLPPLWDQPDRPVAVAPLLGLRQSRQIETDVQVNMGDLVGHARFHDSIGEVDTVADTHSVDYEFETDELAFYYWTCRGFRQPLRSELPYRMLLPRGLTNVWVACRAAGIAVDAAYGLRMQRDIQRLGEAAGIAAADAALHHTDARGIDLPALQAALDRSGARPAERPQDPTPSDDALLTALDQGLPGIHLWHLSRQPARHRVAVTERLGSSSHRVSFYAAALLAQWEDPASEPRLVEALQSREDGPTPEERVVIGAFAQCIDLPFWLQAALLLRRVGTVRCLPALLAAAAHPAQPLNVRTILALTLERLAARVGAQPDLLAALDELRADDIPDPMLPPSRSLWRTLHGEPQKKLGNDRGAPVAQDHTWQLHLAIARARRHLGLPPLPEANAFAQDPRAFVRRAFGQASAA